LGFGAVLLVIAVQNIAPTGRQFWTPVEMHGPSFSGDGAAALLALAGYYDHCISNCGPATGKLAAA
jgi:hypothetical protein